MYSSPRTITRAFVLTLLLALGSGLPTRSRAAHEGISSFWQPFIVEAMGALVLTPVPYATFGYRNHELRHVVTENRVWSQRGFENRNAANLAGLTVAFKHGPTGDGFWGDTVRVALDARAIDTSLLRGTEPDTLVLATLECLRASARAFDGGPYHTVHYLEVEVLEPGASQVFVWDLREPFTPRTDFIIGRRD